MAKNMNEEGKAKNRSSITSRLHGRASM